MNEHPANERYKEAGVKADAGKPPLDLIPWDAVLGAAQVFGFGATKYAPYNWRGLSKSRLFAAAFRHLIAYWTGEDNDPETGMPHTWHALCCVMMLASRHTRDDRPLDEDALHEAQRASREQAARSLIDEAAARTDAEDGVDPGWDHGSGMYTELDAMRYRMEGR